MLPKTFPAARMSIAEDRPESNPATLAKPILVKPGEDYDFEVVEGFQRSSTGGHAGDDAWY
jgi:hypothetical protein